jgi:uncharacterized protein DUF6916
MSIARRNFLKSVTLTTLSAGLALSSAPLLVGQETEKGGRLSIDREFPVPLETEADALFSFRASTFRPYVGDIFQIPNSRGEMIELKLMRVSEYVMKSTTRIATKKVRQPRSFALTFSASEPLPPFTSIQRVSHPALGEFDLFLTGSATDDGTFRYEAVFNHIQSISRQWQ